LENTKKTHVVQNLRERRPCVVDLPAIACKAPPKIPPYIIPVTAATGVTAAVRERDVVLVVVDDDATLLLVFDSVLKGDPSLRRFM
jgi:hypothetical protein